MKIKSDTRIFKSVFLSLLILFLITGCQTYKNVSDLTKTTESSQKLPEDTISHNSTYYEYYNSLQTGLPLLVITTHDNEAILRNSKYHSATIELIDKNFSDIIDENAQIKARGNTSWVYFSKKPYTLKFSKSAQVLDLGKNKKWVLIANYSDKTLIRNLYASVLAQNVFTNMQWVPKNTNVDVIFNNKFVGNYTLSEQIRLGKNRIDVQSLAKVANGKGLDVNKDGVVDFFDGGFILEVDFRQEDDFIWKTKNNCYFSLKDPKPKDFNVFSEQIQQHIKRTVQAAEDAIYTLKDYEKYIDLDSFVDWCIINDFLRNTDSISWVSSAFLYYGPADSKLHMGPIWDFDIAMGNYKQDEYGDLYSPNLFCDKRRWLKKLYKDPKFIQKIKERWSDIREQVLYSINVDVQLLADKNYKSSIENFKIWPTLGKYVWPAPPGYMERTTYQSEVDYLIDWLNARWQWFDKNINKL